MGKKIKISFFGSVFDAEKYGYEIFPKFELILRSAINIIVLINDSELLNGLRKLRLRRKYTFYFANHPILFLKRFCNFAHNPIGFSSGSQLRKWRNRRFFFAKMKGSETNFSLVSIRNGLESDLRSKFLFLLFCGKNS